MTSYGSADIGNLPSLSMMVTVPDAELTGELAAAFVKVTETVKDSTFSTTKSSMMLNTIHSIRNTGVVELEELENVIGIVTGT